MGRKCSVPECKSGYTKVDSPGPSVHVFPKDADLRQKWVRAIHRDEKS